MATRTLIQAVPWLPERTRRAVELRTAAGEANTQIVWDEKQDAFHTWQLVLTAAGQDAVVVLEDDVRLTDSWRSKVEEAIAEHPDHIIQFFSMRGSDLTVGSRFEPGRTFLMNQCYYLPAGYAAALLDFSQRWVEENPNFKTGYDIAMARWMQLNRIKYWIHVPSLVQHEAWRSEINPRRPRNRQSGTFA